MNLICVPVTSNDLLGRSVFLIGRYLIDLEVLSNFKWDGENNRA